MEDLTQRQTDVLKAIIREFTESGEPVGSDILEKKYKLGVSPATIRNEMVELAKKGYLVKSYFSSGRIPSSRGFRFYINHLMREKELSTSDEVAYKNSIWDDRADSHRLLSHATHMLAEKTGLLSLAITNKGDVYYAGVSNLMAISEFLNWELSRVIFERLDRASFWENIFDRVQKLEDNLHFVLSEDDFSDPVYATCASVFGEFEGANLHGMIGVVGPKRMYYDSVAPQIKYFSGLIEQIVKDQGM